MWRRLHARPGRGAATSGGPDTRDVRRAHGQPRRARRSRMNGRSQRGRRSWRPEPSLRDHPATNGRPLVRGHRSPRTRRRRAPSVTGAATRHDPSLRGAGGSEKERRPGRLGTPRAAGEGRPAHCRSHPYQTTPKRQLTAPGPTPRA